jgi:hypothetical protein
MPMQTIVGPWSTTSQTVAQWPPRPGLARQAYGGATEMTHLQYAASMPNRSARFYVRGVRRRGFDFGDPFLLLLLADAEWGCNGLPCPDNSVYP